MSVRQPTDGSTDGQDGPMRRRRLADSLCSRDSLSAPAPPAATPTLARGSGGGSASSSGSVQTCRRCKRTRLYDNPCPSRYPQSTLPFTSGTSSECLICRNYFNGCCKGLERGEFERSIHKATESFETYMRSLSAYEKLFDESKGRF